MRLTLRTMLAYLDGILDRTEAQELGKKVSDSEFASNLVQRVKDVTKQPRLNAPKVDGRGLGLDANSVAEYLDNTMAPDRVPEFERVCLESDVHLAEVASCHQILTMVLGEPVEVESGMRERMYRVGVEATSGATTHSQETGATESGTTETGPTTEGNSQGKGISVSDAAQTLRRTTVAPDYSKTSTRRSLWPIVSTLALAFIVTIVTLLAMGHLDRSHPIYRLVFSDASKAQSVPASSERQQRASEDADVISRPQLPDRSNESDNIRLPSKVDGEDSSSHGQTQSRAVTGEPDSVEPRTVRTAPTTDKTEPRIVSSTEAVPSVPRPLPEAAVSEVAPAKPAPTPVISATDETSIIMGRFISNSQILATWDNQAESWLRLLPDSSLRAGDRLLALPAYRSQILVAPGFQITFAGPSRCVLGPPDAAKWPAISTDYGRLTINTDGKLDAKMHFDFSGRAATAIFHDSDSSLSIEVFRYLPPGSDPAQVGAHNVVIMHATKGRVGWQEYGEKAASAAKVSPLNAGQAKWFVDNGPTESWAAGAPEWMSVNTPNSIDMRAARDLEMMVSCDRPLDLSLMEKAEHRQVEVRALASRCLTYLDEFGPLTAALNSETHRAYWSSYFDAMQVAVARSPQSAAKLRTALEKHRVQDADLMFRLTWGYGAEQLSAGGAKDLIDNLEHKGMDVRVLALENLRVITGKTKLYAPEKTPDRQKRQLREWHDAWEAGEISYKSPPSISPRP